MSELYIKLLITLEQVRAEAVKITGDPSVLQSFSGLTNKPVPPPPKEDEREDE